MEINLSTWQRNFIENAKLIAEKLNISLYLVGGALRDSFLGLPVKDLDLVIIGEGKEFVELLVNNNYGRLVEESQFKTYIIELPNGETIDIACARKEYYEKPGCLPKISLAGDILEDLGRRDFTINSMALGLSKNAENGTLFDPFKGLSDLNNRILRTLHDQSFYDDPTRMIRGIKYIVRYNLGWSSRTRQQINSNYIESISKARQFTEFKLVCKENEVVKNLLLLEQLNILEKIIPGCILPKELNDELIKETILCWKDIFNEILVEWFIWFLLLTKSLSIVERIKIGYEFNFSKKFVSTLSWESFETPTNDYEWHIFLKKLPSEVIVFLLLAGFIDKDLENILSLRKLKKLPLNGQELMNELSLNSSPILGELIIYLEKNLWNGKIIDRQDTISIAKEWLKERKNIVANTN